MINRDIEQITKADLQALVDNGVTERKTIEYKQALPGNSDKEKKEFLADVSSFANASGGDLIYGMVEDKDTGKPKSLDGLDIQNVNEEVLRLEAIIRTGIQPRIPSVTVSPPIALENAKVALIIRVHKSWISPHRVTYDGHDKFYSRSSNGKYHLDVAELRVAFNLSETTTERIRNFRIDRIAKIVANETPVPFQDNPKTVLHLIPAISFDPAQSYDTLRIYSDFSKMMKPMYCQGSNERYNLDGLLAHSWNKERISHSYVQFFRNGIIEAVEGLLLEPDEGRRTIPSIVYEQELIKSLADYLSFLKTLNVEPPIFIFLTLLGVKGYSMGVNTWKHRIHEVHTIDRDILQLPEVVTESYNVSAERVLKPCFDSIWNACGFPRSLDYNDKGEWAPS